MINLKQRQMDQLKIYLKLYGIISYLCLMGKKCSDKLSKKSETSWHYNTAIWR